MRRIIWGHHPTRSHLKITGQYHTSMCPLCGETDMRDHVFCCQTINSSRLYKEIRDERRHFARYNGLPYYMINTVTTVLKGRNIESNKTPTNMKNIYTEQAEIGWRNLALGRITTAWSEARITDGRGMRDTGKYVGDQQ